MEDSSLEATSLRAEKEPPPAGEAQNVFLLTLLYALYLGCRSGCMVVLPIASRELLREVLQGAEHSPLYQLPLALWFGLDVPISIACAHLLQAWGPGRVFRLGEFAALLGALLAFLVLRLCSHLPVLAYVCLNLSVTLLSSVGIMEFTRYTASDACREPERKRRATSFVVSGGVVLSLSGPFAASFASEGGGRDLLAAMSNFFLVVALFCCLGAAAAACLRLPAAQGGSVGPEDVQGEEHMGAAPPTWQILKRPAVSTTIMATVVVQLTMLGPVAALPLEMQGHLHRHEAVDVRISGCVALHEFCMFAPGLVAGGLANCRGPRFVVLLGLLLMGGCMAVALCGSGLWNFYLAMALLGVGWNFAFVASTTLLLESHGPVERAKVTSVSEAVRYAANASACLAGAALPWGFLSGACLALLGLAMLALMAARPAAEPEGPVCPPPSETSYNPL